jgi:hypothetical protein
VTEPVPALVTLHLWRVGATGVPRALLRMGRDRARVRRTPGLRFAKLLGTGDGRTFTVRDADPHRWGLLATWTSPEAAQAFERRSPVSRAWRRLRRRPGAPTCGRSPRAAPGAAAARRRPGPRPSDGRSRHSPAPAAPVAALGFWRAVPPVSADLRDRPGLRAAVGIGRRRSACRARSACGSRRGRRRFAAGAAHAEVVARTGPERWYAEELFARFDVVGTAGTLDGRDPLA